MSTNQSDEMIDEVKSIKKIEDFMNFIHKIGDTPRAGLLFMKNWNESVGTHTFKMVFMCFFFINYFKLDHLDLKKCILMCLVHDSAEAYIGDIVPIDINFKAKHICEENVIKKVFSKIDSSEDNLKNCNRLFEDLVNSYKEYGSKESEEALFIKFIDKVDFLQELIRERKNISNKHKARVEELYEDVRNEIYQKIEWGSMKNEFLQIFNHIFNNQENFEHIAELEVDFSIKKEK